jgi:hypothetical protein
MFRSGAVHSVWNAGCLKDDRGHRRLEAARGTEGADDDGDVLVLGVDGVVEATHVGGGEFASEIGESGSELRELCEGGLPDDGDGVVGREVVAVVSEGDEAEGIDEAVGGVAGDDVDLMI